MAISPLTPSSLIASVNLKYLREALKDLERNHDFHTDPGFWCCRKCATAEAWDKGVGKPFVFWDEQNEDFLHKYSKTNLSMALCFGVAKTHATDQEIVGAARKIINVLAEHDLACEWENEDIDSAITVHLDKHEPEIADDYCDGDYMEVDLYLPKNEDTEEFCLNESDERYEPEGTYF